MDEFLQAAGVSGFDVLAVDPGRWPKLVHRETKINVDILPEGQRPGTPSRPAPTTIAHPSQMGASGNALRYAHLPALVELKLAAGRAQDQADVIKLIQANPDQAAAIREHLARTHGDYVSEFDRLAKRAREEAGDAR